MAKILIIDDDTTFCMMLGSLLSKNGFTVKTAFTFNEGLKALKAESFDVILSDIRLPDRNGLEFLHEINYLPCKCQVIVMTGYGDIRTAVNAIKMGAFEYVTKPLNPDEVLFTVNQALKENGKKEKKQENTLQFINGISSVSQKMNEYVSLVAPTNMSVIILGESGTGKEYVARKIHQESARAGKPFIAMDCGAIPKELAPSEFFGHIKGAFTGAVSDKTGHFIEANGGTLFLDEIGNLTYDVQVQLLRAIQEKNIRPVGSNKVFNVDVRLIVATNEDLVQAVSKGEFREDLYHRLNEFSIQVPRLCERDGDLIIFAHNFLESANAELNKNVDDFNEEVISIFTTYTWPGNIRELKNVVKRAVLLAKTNLITAECLPRELVTFNPTERVGLTTDNLKELKDKIEYQRIVAVLEKVKYNKTKAAQMLNIDRKTLYNKLKLYNLEG
ncbi:MAG TPA: sigma-54 dependent transcriptional regulator [Bacteroidales bacterium]|nr:sigma-54 dependent transcriptional regulator [Bacteroidales bacterium]